MQFRIADTFTDRLAKLTGDEQKAVRTAAFDLQDQGARWSAKDRGIPGGATGPETGVPPCQDTARSPRRGHGSRPCVETPVSTRAPVHAGAACRSGGGR